MRCFIQPGVTCLPVTALHTTKHGDVTVLLSNQGSSLSVRYGNDTEAIYRHRIFRSQTIHGIISSVIEKCDTTTKHDLIIWGGRFLRRCILKVTSDNVGTPFVDLKVGSLIQVNDWIVTIVFHRDQLYNILLTAHNALWRLDSGDTTSLTLVGQGPDTLLYSGAIILSHNDYLIASGTVFGDVIFWTFSGSPGVSGETKTRYVFRGHRGSVFGVAISDLLELQGGQRRFVASCSDDRTIRIWNVSDWEQNAHRDVEVCMNDTGFASDEDQSLQVTMVWGHLSRIWSIYFGSLDPSSPERLSLISRGEDGVCQFWQLELDSLRDNSNNAKAALKPIANDRHHAGKNTWSLDLCTDRRVLTGGADGQIVSRCFPETNSSFKSSVTFDVISQMLGDSTMRTLRQYLAIDENTIVATTGQGGLVRINILELQVKRIPTIGSNTVTTLSSNCHGGMFFYCLVDGSLCAYDIQSNVYLGIVHSFTSQASWMQIIHHSQCEDTSQFYIITNVKGENERTLLKLVRKNNRFTALSRKISIPTDFVVTTALYYADLNILLCGSRYGAMAIFSDVSVESNSLSEHVIVSNVQGSDTITSIMDVPEAISSSPGTILTTGRDGSYAIHRITLGDNVLTFRTLHRASPPFGPCIEGAFVRLAPGEEARLILYGFKSKDFVLWDETLQTQLFSVDCGGGQRSWNYFPSAQGADMFAWTRAGTLSFCSKIASTHETVQSGGHGREIKAAALSTSSGLSERSNGEVCPFTLLATGAEDTDIRIFRLTSTSISHMSVLKHHTTGLQALKFSLCGNYLFSSGGMEEFVVWNIASIPLIGIGAVIAGQLGKTKEDEDVRIMGFDIVEAPMVANVKVFTILMAYSNGKAKVLEFTHDALSNSSRFNLVQQLCIGMLCLTQAEILVDETFRAILLGATDGCLRFANLDTTKDVVATRKVHQSNISAMSTHRLATGLFLVATGGDDNALVLSFLSTENLRDKFEVLSVPNAHAAVVTGVAIVGQAAAFDGTLLVVTAGNDQRIKVWRILGVESSYELIDPRNVEVEQVAEYPTDVADVSTVSIRIDHHTNRDRLGFEAIVVGVGIQCVRIEIDVERILNA